MEVIKNSGGDVFNFSSFHQSGEKLNNLGGIAAILRYYLLFIINNNRFPLNLDYLDDDEEKENNDNENLEEEEDEVDNNEEK